MKIVFLCHFSNPEVRSRLSLKSWALRNWICKLMKHPLWSHSDFAVWVDDFITEFKKHTDEHEFHIVAPHTGMRKRYQSYVMDGIHYHFYKEGSNLLSEYIDAKFHLSERNDYRKAGKRTANIISDINPDVVCLCGAENPSYGAGIFHIKGIPVFLIPQTFLNDGKRMAMKVATPYRAVFEKKVFSKVDVISTCQADMISFVKDLNPKVQICNIGFPTHKPTYDHNIKKEYDFVFFAKTIAVFKGIEDAIKALAIVKETHPNVSLAIIGGCNQDYQIKLNELILSKGLKSNVCFLGHFPTMDEVYRNVQYARIAVLPGITAALNSTVREALALRLPTITYMTVDTESINEKAPTIHTSEMQNIDELSAKMIDLLDNKELYELYSQNAAIYAKSYFDNAPIVDKLLDILKNNH